MTLSDSSVLTSARAAVPYGQGRARGLGADALGVHGVEMDNLVALGLPVVPGLTVPIGSGAGLRVPDTASATIDLLEKLAVRGIWPSVRTERRPMLLHLRCSAPVPVSALPPAISVIGLSPLNVDALVEVIGRDRDIYDSWAATLRFVAEGALDVDTDDLDDLDEDHPDSHSRVPALLELIERATGSPFPTEPAEQLGLAATAMLARWASPRGQRARRSLSLPDDLGLALHVRALRLGPWDDSGHGSAVSRDLETGKYAPHGVFHLGVRKADPNPGPGEPLSSTPGGEQILDQIFATLEPHLRGVAEIEFEVRDRQLALLSAGALDHPGPRAVTNLAVDLANARSIDRSEAVRMLEPDLMQDLLHAQLTLTGSEQLLVRGLPASPGAAVGEIALSSDRALALAAQGKAVILVASETSPADVPALLAATAVVTSNGGLASHAAVVARGAGRPAVCGAATIRIDREHATVTTDGVTLAEGDTVSVNGRTGDVYVGTVAIRPAEPSPELEVLLGWADDIRELRIRTNADNADDAATAFRLGAEGIGLCRTEHQFLGDQLPLVQRLVLAESEAEEIEAIAALTAAQQSDFTDLLRVVGDRPVTVRLLDAPLHEFLPADGHYRDREQAERAAATHESNPMLGLRGVRFAMVQTRLYPAQAEALFRAWVVVNGEGMTPQLEVMIPLVSLPGELTEAIAQVHRAAATVAADTGVTVPYLVGSMIETPRAALLAEPLAAEAQFLSFGTNDLTQLTYGFSRDDVEKTVLAHYLEHGLLTDSPFAVLDRDGVGALVSMAVDRARTARPDVKLGVCGEHGGDPQSISFLNSLGLHYVSCSPRRVPVARLAAAHATLESR
ncbi:pyruvate, phosphate dikinase [Rhodococcus sp. 05-340-1]|uniref:putative PEP-binding protein n=1 Tax=unclassified Rhodococcus (in: high G+C Gram-positive bacteria) TaxID=192944 RepID=UPI000B9C4A56|nr:MULTISPECIES: putative PEP-binding protein [unclassified Rhodococcus (in: high G+C Gram-positive bacteria)]OZD68581.1 pyruvate, phosphate dikinase [Rhodococcus sp. 05-340-2]OZD70159.1 pyruvate, phosphate dikinase [Rhodococcus sp. 05-340-1]